MVHRAVFGIFVFLAQTAFSGPSTDKPVEKIVRSCAHKECVHLNDIYSKDAKHIYIDTPDYSGVVAKADPKTFVLLNPSDESAYTKDRSKVYFLGEVVPHADPKTFVALNERYGKDATRLFLMKDVLVGPDHKSFRTPYKRNVWLARDKRSVYESGKPVTQVDPDSLEVLAQDMPCGKDCRFRYKDKNHKFDWDFKPVD